jgi:hypothetical protein
MNRAELKVAGPSQLPASAVYCMFFVDDATVLDATHDRARSCPRLSGKQRRNHC